MELLERRPSKGFPDKKEAEAELASASFLFLGKNAADLFYFFFRQFYIRGFQVIDHLIGAFGPWNQNVY
jgi:hypothetical protein